MCTLNLTSIASLPLQLIPLSALLAYYLLAPSIMVVFAPDTVYFTPASFGFDVLLRLFTGTILIELYFVLCWMIAVYPVDAVLSELFATGYISVTDPKYNWRDIGTGSLLAWATQVTFATIFSLLGFYLFTGWHEVEYLE